LFRSRASANAVTAAPCRVVYTSLIDVVLIFYIFFGVRSASLCLDWGCYAGLRGFVGAVRVPAADPAPPSTRVARVKGDLTFA